MAHPDSQTPIGAFAIWLVFPPAQRQEPGAGEFETGQVTARSFETLSNDQSSERFAAGLAAVIERVLATNFINILRQSTEPAAKRAEFLVEGAANIEGGQVSLSVDFVAGVQCPNTERLRYFMLMHSTAFHT